MKSSILQILLAVVLGAFGQICFKLGSSSFSGNIIDNIFMFFKNKFLFFGILIYGISTIIYTFSLKNMSLSLAYPLVSVGYILVMVLSYFILHEDISIQKIIGSLLIITGIIITSIK